MTEPCQDLVGDLHSVEQRLSDPESPHLNTAQTGSDLVHITEQHSEKNPKRPRTHAIDSCERDTPCRKETGLITTGSDSKDEIHEENVEKNPKRPRVHTVDLCELETPCREDIELITSGSDSMDEIQEENVENNSNCTTSDEADSYLIKDLQTAKEILDSLNDIRETILSVCTTELNALVKHVEDDAHTPVEQFDYLEAQVQSWDTLAKSLMAKLIETLTKMTSGISKDILEKMLYSGTLKVVDRVVTELKLFSKDTLKLMHEKVEILRKKVTPLRRRERVQAWVNSITNKDAMQDID